MVMFPCWLPHRVAPFAEKPAESSSERHSKRLGSRRVSVGFNLQLRRAAVVVPEGGGGAGGGRRSEEL